MSTRLGLLLAAILSTVVGLVFIVLSIIGSWNWFHPLLYWDMWDGYLAFWFQLEDGNPGIWWELSNEHHLVIPKALFWVDFALLGGSGWFLIGLNLLFIGLIAAVLVTLLISHVREVRSSLAPLLGIVTLAAVLVVLPFSWMQGEEIVFGYHVQFLLSTLLPLLAFVALGGASLRSHGFTWLAWSAVLTSALSPWAGASGLLVPFVAAGLAWTLRMSWRVSVVFVVVGVGNAILYSIGGSPFGGEGGPLQNIANYPLDVARFWLVYLGGPWTHLTGNQWFGGVAGCVFVLITVGYLVRQLRSEARTHHGLAAVAFPIFMLAMGALTAAGRVNASPDQVLAIRYLTPMLTAWACLLVLAAPGFQRLVSGGSLLPAVAVVVIPLLLLPDQTQSLDVPRDRLQERDVAALSIALGIRDQAALSAVYPLSPDRPLDLGQRAIAEGLTYLGKPPYPALRDRVGSGFTPVTSIGCVGWLDSRTPIEGASFDRVEGWVVGTGIPPLSGIYPVLDETSRVVGFIQVGKLRADVLDLVPDAGDRAGYSGYLLSTARPDTLTVAGESFQCRDRLTSAVPAG